MAVIQQIARVRENDNQRSWARDKTIAGGETYILGSQDNGCWFLKTYDIGTQSYRLLHGENCRNRMWR